MDQALFEIYERNFPFNIRKKDTVLQILGHRDNVVLERREEGKGLIGVSVIHRNAVLMLCVDGKYRNRGIGTQLLEKSEQLVRERGFSEIVIAVQELEREGPAKGTVQDCGRDRQMRKRRPGIGERMA